MSGWVRIHGGEFVHQRDDVECTREEFWRDNRTKPRSRRRQIQKMLKIMPLLVVMLRGAAQMMAQASGTTQDETMRKLQTRMDEMRSQMDQMQDEMRSQMAQMQAKLDAMHGVNTLANVVNDVKQVPEPLQTGAIERTVPPLPPTVVLTAEQQLMAVGRETMEYKTFSDESESAPRLYNAPLEPTYPGFFVLPGTQTMLRINGSLKTDLMFDPRPAGVPDEFTPSTIPIPAGPSTNNFNASIRESRISSDFRAPVSNVGTARMFMQFDFFGSNGATTPRLRHAYAQLKNILVGQTNTVFVDPDTWPDIVENRGPTSGFRSRPPQIRYSFPLGRGMSGAISVEQPRSDISFSQNGSAAVPITPAPDGVLRLRYEGERGHMYLSTVLRELAVHLPNGGPQASTFGWGLNLASTWRVARRDTVNYQVAYGNGISKYANDTAGQGLDAAPRTQADLTLKALPLFAPWISYQHYWTRSVRSSATFGWLQLQNTAFQPGNTYHKSSYSSVNIIWNSMGSLTFGTEFMYGMGGAEGRGSWQCAPPSVRWKIFLCQAA